MSTTPAPRDPGVEYKFKTKRLVIQDRSSRKDYEKMLANGWEVDHIADGFGRSSHYVFRRPIQKLSAREDPGSLGGAVLRGIDKLSDPEFQKKGNARLDRINAGLDRMEAKADQKQADRIAKREARAAAKKSRKGK